jgi:predicted TIM-barrel fold metal-dependent hydrolase
MRKPIESRASRRQFLGGAALAAAQILSPAEAVSAPIRIIDTHIHLYDPNRPQGVPWPPKDNKLLYRPTMPSDFHAATRGLGVTGVVVVEASVWLEDNQWILDLARDNLIIKGFVGHLEPGDSFQQNLGRFAKNRLFRGIRLSGRTIAAGLSRPDFLAGLQQLADHDLQLDAIGDHTIFADLVRLTDSAPQLRIVINHLPFDPAKDEDARRKADNALRELGRRPQVYAKVSGILRRTGGRVPLESSFYRDALDQLWATFGPSRVVYGSNWPVSNQFAPYPAVLKVAHDYFAGKGQDAADRYFWKNSLAAYKWIDRG